jgi:hypothetical protein
MCVVGHQVGGWMVRTAVFSKLGQIGNKEEFGWQQLFQNRRLVGVLLAFLISTNCVMKCFHKYNIHWLIKARSLRT